MKKLIAIAVVFALVAGGLFAVDLGGNVIGSVVIVEANSVKDSKIMSYGLFNRWRLEGAGENGDGTFGGWLRWESPWYAEGFGGEGLVWWKPIDQFKLSIGGNSDGIFGKEGYAGWMFKQIANDTSVVKADQAWGGAYNQRSNNPFTGDWGDIVIGRDDDGNPAGYNVIFRNAFFGGFDGNGLMLEVKPIDMIAINLAVPFISETGKPWKNKELKDIFMKFIAQIDLNFDFGNIALTYIGGAGNKKEGGVYTSTDPAKFRLYFGLTAIENLSLDVGLGYSLPAKYYVNTTYSAPMSIGLAAKYQINDSFGLKARAMVELAGSFKTPGYVTYKMPFAMIFEVLPFFAINDSVTIYADIGLNMIGKRKYNGTDIDEKALVGFHFNPYVGIGSEWGPTFFVGLNVYTTGAKWGPDNKTRINFEVPIALHVGF